MRDSMQSEVRSRPRSEAQAGGQPGGAIDTAASDALNPLEARYLDARCRVLMTGVQALARVPLDRARLDRAAGLDTAGFISGYEGSPLAGYDLELARQRRLLDEHGIRFEPGLNEEAAATAVQGSQLIRELRPTVEGVVGYWYGKAPGLDRASDALRHANLMGADPCGGAVALVGDDPAAKSSSVPCASEFALADMMMPVFYPCDAADVLALGRHAVAMSRASGLWSSMKIVTKVADGAATVDLQAGEGFDPLLPLGAGLHEPTSRLLQPTLGPLERDMLTTRVRIAREYVVLNGLNRTVRRADTDRIGIITAGTEYLDTMQALHTLGFGGANAVGGSAAENTATVRVMKIDVIWPLDAAQLREFAEGLDKIIVIEEKRAFIELQVLELLYHSDHRPVVVGKRDEQGRELFPPYGELLAETVTKALARELEGTPGMPSVDEWLAARRASTRGIASGGRISLPLATRTPYFCSGCPHNSSTKPRTDSAFGAGIGCHAMVLLMDSKQVGEVVGLTQMGGEGTQWIGMAPFVENGHFVQNLGDGTFHHSGSLAIRASIAAKTNITYRILFNSTVAMTGGQQAIGQLSVSEMAAELLAEGVARVIVTSSDPRALRRKLRVARRLPAGVELWHRERLEEAQRLLAEVQGTTVLIHEQECATELRRKRKRGLAPKPAEFVMINERICEGCGDCGEKSNCLSVQPVETEFGRKTRIHQSSCNVDRSCLDGNCPAFVTVRPGSNAGAVGARAVQQGRGSRVDDLSPESLPAPPVSGRVSHRIRLMGVGGTGVVTTSQLLATAALLSGRYARTLDRTGLAQKGGAVVSDIAIEPAPFEAGSSISVGECDLYLGYDLLVAADPTHTTALATDATAIVSTSIVPTGAMVSDRTVTFPEVGDTLARIADRVDGAGGGALVELDLRRYAEGLFGAEQLGNMFMLGIAVQRGALGLLPEAIEEAISLNGVSTQANLQAFRRGRQFVADRAALDSCLRALEGERGEAVADASPRPSEIVRARAGSELERLVAIRRAELVAYQHERYARRYEEIVEEMRCEEATIDPGSTRLAEAVARHLYKLMAYKDEYEVARLALEPQFEAAVAEQFGEAASYRWRLHPPMLKTMGMKRKIALGAWFRPGFAMLRAGRRLRGTAFDPFGYDEIRRIERGLIAEYVAELRAVLPRLGEVGIDAAVELAELPDLIRGYDEVKLRGVEAYRERLAELLEKL